MVPIKELEEPYYYIKACPIHNAIEAGFNTKHKKNKGKICAEIAYIRDCRLDFF